MSPGTDKEQKGDPSRKVDDDAGARYLALAQGLAKAVARNIPRQPVRPRAWARQMRLMVEQDGASAAEIERVTAWLLEAPTNVKGFSWAKVIVSGESLRNNFPRLLLEAGSADTKAGEQHGTCEDVCASLFGH